MMQIDVVKRLVPRSQRALVTEDFLQKLEDIANDSKLGDMYKENFVTYLNVLSKGKYKMEDYLNAIKYISFKLLNYTNIDAYAATFPDRYQRLINEGQKQIDSYVSAYNSNKLVMQIYEQTLVPSYILNAPLHQEALNELALMIQDKKVGGMVKVKACETILNYTKPPEVIKNELTIGIEQSDTIADLREVTENLADTYKAMLESGTTTLQDIAKSKIIDVEPEGV